MLGPAPTRGRRVAVLLPYPFAGPFDYRVPADLDPQPGELVMVPLNRREEVGVVWDGPPDHSVGDNRLRAVIAVLDAPPMGADIRHLVDWISSYTLSPPGAVLAMALRTNALRAEPTPVGWLRAAPPPEFRVTEARRQVLDALAAREPQGGAALMQSAQVSAAVIRGLADAGALIPVTMPAPEIATGFMAGSAPRAGHRDPADARATDTTSCRGRAHATSRWTSCRPAPAGSPACSSSARARRARST